MLAAIVEAHIDTAEPVGSKSLAEREELDCSPATIRNVMGQLHERGLIAKPHTSAGRVPTHAGFRYFVDYLLKLKEPPEKVRQEVEKQLERAGTVDRAIEEAGRLLSRLAKKAAVVRVPRSEAVRLKQIELVRLRDDAILVILITAEGIVQNRLLELGPEPGVLMSPGSVPKAPSDDELLRMSRLLSERMAGRTLAEVRAMLEEEAKKTREELDALEEKALALGRAAVESGGDGEDKSAREVVVEGEHHLLDPKDVGSVARMHELFEVLEERSRLIELLDRAEEAPGIRIFIGEENPLRELAEMSVITASYGNGVEVLGTLGVIGPTRMDYARVVPLVELTAQTVSRLLT